MKELSRNNSILLFVLLTGLLVVIAFISYNKFLHFNKTVDLLAHTKEVKSKIIEVASNLKYAETGQRAYLLTDNSIFLETFNEAKQQRIIIFKELNSLLRDNSRQLKNLNKLKSLVDQRYSYLENNILFIKNNDQSFSNNSVIFNGQNKSDEVTKGIYFMLRSEDKLLAERELAKDRTAAITPIFLLSLSLFSIFVITLFFFRLQKETGIRISATESNVRLQEAYKLIEASEKRFSNILTQSIMAIGILKGNNMDITFANDPLITTWGKGDDVIGKSIFEVMPEIKNQGFDKLLHEVYNTGIPYYGNEICVNLSRHEKEEKVFYNLVFQPFRDQDDTITGIIILATEITDHILSKIQNEEKKVELKKLSRLFKLATDSAKIGIWSLDIDSSKLEWSNIHKTMWGYDLNAKELSYPDWFNPIFPEDKAFAFLKAEEAKDKHRNYDVEYRIIRVNDNAIRWMRSTGQYQYDPLGNAKTLTGISYDITERKIADEELEKKVNERTEELAVTSKQLVEINHVLELKNEELENANQELESFSYVASHDLQEPLRKIQGFSKRILSKEDERLSETTKDYFNRINGAAQRMQNLIESLLSFSHTNFKELIFEKTDLNKTLSGVKNVLSDIIKQKKAKIEAQTLPTLQAVPVQMHQLFLNLISNSLKYAKTDVSPLIKITAQKLINKEVQGRTQQNSEFWEITFSDNGIGFDQLYENKIFEVFQRLHGKTEYEGTGIGLSICKKIAHAHNGTITALGVPNVGSTFKILLPP